MQGSSKFTCEASRKTLKAIIKKGNLDGVSYDKLKTLNIVIEEHTCRRTPQKDSFEVITDKVSAIFMRSNIDIHRANNLLMPPQKIRTFYISAQDPFTKHYYAFVNQLFTNHGPATECVTLRTILHIDQNLYEPAAEVKYKEDMMTQEILYEEANGNREKHRVTGLMGGLPLPLEKVLLSW